MKVPMSRGMRMGLLASTSATNTASFMNPEISDDVLIKAFQGIMKWDTARRGLTSYIQDKEKRIAAAKAHYGVDLPPEIQLFIFMLGDVDITKQYVDAAIAGMVTKMKATNVGALKRDLANALNARNISLDVVTVSESGPQGQVNAVRVGKVIPNAGRSVSMNLFNFPIDTLISSAKLDSNSLDIMINRVIVESDEAERAEQQTGGGILRRAGKRISPATKSLLLDIASVSQLVSRTASNLMSGVRAIQWRIRSYRGSVGTAEVLIRMKKFKRAKNIIDRVETFRNYLIGIAESGTVKNITKGAFLDPLEIIAKQLKSAFASGEAIEAAKADMLQPNVTKTRVAALQKIIDKNEANIVEQTSKARNAMAQLDGISRKLTEVEGSMPKLTFTEGLKEFGSKVGHGLSTSGSLARVGVIAVGAGIGYLGVEVSSWLMNLGNGTYEDPLPGGEGNRVPLMRPKSIVDRIETLALVGIIAAFVAPPLMNALSGSRGGGGKGPFDFGPRKDNRGRKAGERPAITPAGDEKVIKPGESLPQGWEWKKKQSD